MAIQGERSTPSWSVLLVLGFKCIYPDPIALRNWNHGV